MKECGAADEQSGAEQLTFDSSTSSTTHSKPDVSFRVFKLDDSNMKDVYYSAEEYSQDTLDEMVSNIKEGRTALDLFFGCLLDWGLPLSMPYHSEEIDGCTVHTYNDGDLIACFDKNTRKVWSRKLPSVSRSVPCSATPVLLTALRKSMSLKSLSSICRKMPTI